MRSLLFVPADSERKIPKALASQADVVILDLEDSVAMASKEAARGRAAEVLSQARTTRLFVRVNGLTTGLALSDLEAVMPQAPDGLVLPKSESGDDVDALGQMVRSLAGGADTTPILAIATETAASLFNLGTYRGARNLLALAWGMEDLATALGAQSNRDAMGHASEPYRLARTLCLIGARAAGAEPVDAVHANYRDLAGLDVRCREAARDGFTAKLCIHPDQVPLVNAAFTPSAEAVARARRIVEAFAAAGHAGVIGLDGEMLDLPHLEAARRLLARRIVGQG